MTIFWTQLSITTIHFDGIISKNNALFCSMLLNMFLYCSDYLQKLASLLYEAVDEESIDSDVVTKVLGVSRS